MNKMLVSISRELGNNEFVILFDNGERNMEITCHRQEWCAPFYGKILCEQDIQDLIIFLHEHIREIKENGQNNMA